MTSKLFLGTVALWLVGMSASPALVRAEPARALVVVATTQRTIAAPTGGAQAHAAVSKPSIVASAPVQGVTASAVRPVVRSAATPARITTFAVLESARKETVKLHQAYPNVRSYSPGPELRRPNGTLTSAGAHVSATSLPRLANGRFAPSPSEAPNANIVGGHPTQTKDWGGEFYGYAGTQRVTAAFDARTGKPLQSESIIFGGKVGQYLSRSKVEYYNNLPQSGRR